MRTRPGRPVPRLDAVSGSLDEARDVVVLAHGGQEHSYERATDLRAPLLRMWPFAAAAKAEATTACIALMRYRYRGWNGDNADAGTDLRTVLAGLPATVERVVLIGHSMGGRAVVANADDHRVVGILALAPWLPPEEPITAPDGRLIVTAHGTDDTITNPHATADHVRRLRDCGRAVAELSVEGDTHAMLHRHRDWSELVRRHVRSCFGVVDPIIADALTTEVAAPTPLPHWHKPSRRGGAVLDIASACLRLRRPPRAT